jgi:hypothetical protein
MIGDVVETGPAGANIGGRGIPAGGDVCWRIANPKAKIRNIKSRIAALKDRERGRALGEFKNGRALFVGRE